MTGHVLIHAELLTPQARAWAAGWLDTGTIWESPRRGFYVLPCAWPSHTIARLVAAGWPAAALEAGGR
jgi:hypothetical protein